jgi:hypothetical protein
LENREENTKSQAIIKVGKTKMIHILGINPFQAQSFPSQNRILRGRAGQSREGEGDRERDVINVSETSQSMSKQTLCGILICTYWQFSYSLQVLKTRENLGSRPVLS